MSEAEETRAEVRAVLRRMVKEQTNKRSDNWPSVEERRARSQIEMGDRGRLHSAEEDGTGGERKENLGKNHRRLYKAMKLVSSRWPLPPPAA